MRFQVLGPLRFRDGAGGWQLIPAAQQRVVLAVLLAETGRPVSVDQLIAEIWGEQPPRTALRTLQGYVFRLRRMLEGPKGTLETQDGGYALHLGEDDIDAQRFEHLVAVAKASPPQETAERLSQALALWKGPAFADVTAGPVLSSHIARLESSKLDTVEDWLGALLALDRTAEVAVQAQRLVLLHPLRERLYEQLIVALHRGGRRAEALECYQRARDVLVGELGVEPGSRLRQLHHAILIDEPDLSGHQSSGAVVRVAAQLPADAAGFTGRDAEVKYLDEMLDHRSMAPVVVTVTGPPGAGKTALAVHWAHQIRDRFPDGQLYVSLRGYASSPPLRPIDALAGFLAALGVPADQVPTEADDAAALYRSLLADRQVLVLLDNANHPDQVRPLLPASPASLVLITSRDRMDGLVAREGVTRLALEALPPGDAETLLSRIVGVDRIAAEPVAAAEVARLCGFLPLALRIAAANLAAHPARSIADYSRQLTSDDRLAALEVDEDEPSGVRAAISTSYLALREPARRLFRLLGLPPGPDITVPAAAALADITPEDARRLLNRLCAVHLATEPASGRYALHDLLRLYATQQAMAEESQPDREAALDRWYQFHLGSVDAAAVRLYPQILRLPLPGIARSNVEFHDEVEASAWLDAERANLVAAIVHAARHGPRSVAWRLADAMRGYLYLTVSIVDWDTVASAGLAAAIADGDLLGQAAAHLSFAMLHHNRDSSARAMDHYANALEAARQGRWRAAESAAIGNLGNLHWTEGRLGLAADLYTQALAIDEEAGWLAGEAVKLLNIGQVRRTLGQLDLALQHHLRALSLFQRLGSQGGQARSLVRLGETYYALGRLDEAQAALTSALDTHRQVADRDMEANTLRLLALIHSDAGRYSQAQELASTSLTLAREGQRPHQEADALIAQAGLHHRTGRHREAVDGYQHALHIARTIHDRGTELTALIGLAKALHNSDESELGKSYALQALAISREHGYRLLESDALDALATIENEPDQARHYYQQAQTIYAETGYQPNRT